eukprot:scaffold33434_cov71-Phaeocystis_antarctica.AAC.3
MFITVEICAGTIYTTPAGTHGARTRASPGQRPRHPALGGSSSKAEAEKAEAEEVVVNGPWTV